MTQNSGETQPTYPLADFGESGHLRDCCGCCADCECPRLLYATAAERSSSVRGDEAEILFPALWRAHEYLRRTDAPDANKVAVVLGILDRAHQAWTDANPLPDDEDQFDDEGSAEESYEKVMAFAQKRNLLRQKGSSP